MSMFRYWNSSDPTASVSPSCPSTPSRSLAYIVMALLSYGPSVSPSCPSTPSRSLAYIVWPYIVMACIVMAYIFRAGSGAPQHTMRRCEGKGATRAPEKSSATLQLFHVYECVYTHVHRHAHRHALGMVPHSVGKLSSRRSTKGSTGVSIDERV